MPERENLLCRELENHFIEQALASKVFNPSWHVMESLSECVRVLQARLRRTITASLMRQALQHSRSMKITQLTRAHTLSDGTQSNEAVFFELYRVLGKPAAQASHYRKHLQEQQHEVRAAILELSATSLQLSAGGGLVRFQNAGYGTDGDLDIIQVEHPDWLTVDMSPLLQQATLKSATRVAGHHQGQVVFHTRTSSATLEVTHIVPLQHLQAGPWVHLDDLLPLHRDLDCTRTAKMYHQVLLEQGYQELPGGLYHRGTLLQNRVEVTRQWRLSAEMIEQCFLPASGHEAGVVFADEAENLYRLECVAGRLQGQDLRLLFELFEVQPFMGLQISPHLGHWKISWHPVEPWRNLPGYHHVLCCPAGRLRHHPVLEHLLEQRPVGGRVEVVTSHAQPIPRDLLQMQRKGEVVLHFLPQDPVEEVYSLDARSTWACLLPDGPLEWREPTATIRRLLKLPSVVSKSSPAQLVLQPEKAEQPSDRVATHPSQTVQESSSMTHGTHATQVKAPAEQKPQHKQPYQTPRLTQKVRGIAASMKAAEKSNSKKHSTAASKRPAQLRALQVGGASKREGKLFSGQSKAEKAARLKSKPSLPKKASLEPENKISSARVSPVRWKPVAPSPSAEALKLQQQHDIPTYQNWKPEVVGAPSDEVHLRHLLEILQVEGPIHLERLLNIYAQAWVSAAGLEQRLHLTKLLDQASQKKQVVFHHAVSVEGQWAQFVRLPHTPPTVLRTRGDRSMAEIPQGEVVAAISCFSENRADFSVNRALSLLADFYGLRKLEFGVRQFFEQAYQIWQNDCVW
ncbi:hypothetical protein [Deinococcus roseus]|uniref:Polymerase nucleotidyl transferase domain-containing protein n=1 Tax=Deinococcus roseus TaxID=392414 RepID=A0ABQ2D172_9DEIO|nr:hypothetical protein [Deinococcus roseus]GGJ36371.1 hypothetical protein GCM10008938_23070 [Deinococcus roseus]